MPCITSSTLCYTAVQNMTWNWSHQSTSVLCVHTFCTVFLTWLLWCRTEIRFMFCCYVLQSVFSCLSGLVFFICLSLSAKLPFLCTSEKSLCLPVVCIEFLYPLVWLLLLARKQSKYNCSLSGPPRHWFIHSLLQVGVTNPRGSQPIHTTKI